MEYYQKVTVKMPKTFLNPRDNVIKPKNIMPNRDNLVWRLIVSEDKLLVSQDVALSLLSNINGSAKQPGTHQLH